ncbi:MAG: hypothetical protein HY329_10905 [Chloroflexi bacterium]|nr:hypothetical protein [Chloroflexota bacterium]
MRVGLIGLGTMGRAIALNVLGSGHTLVVHDLYPRGGRSIARRIWDAVQNGALGGMLTLHHGFPTTLFGGEFDPPAGALALAPTTWQRGPPAAVR